MADYVICARNIDGKKFGSEPAPATYLAIENDAAPKPSSDQIVKADVWAKRVIAEAQQGGVATSGMGNVLVFVHGFNNDQGTVMQRHRKLRDDLNAAQFRGVVVSFDWPSGDVGLFYLEDLADANHSALQLVAGGILLLASFQQPDCPINVHILAHSMGAYVTREAFTAADDADDLTGKTWRVSQVMLIAGDISSRSLSATDHRTEGLYRNCTRLTCYSNRHDNVLALSNVKRAGVAPRAGRVGLPDSSPPHAVNVDCSDYWKQSIDGSQQQVIGSREHSWHIGDPVFTKDMLDNMNGADREVRPTRASVDVNRFALIRPA